MGNVVRLQRQVSHCIQRPFQASYPPVHTPAHSITRTASITPTYQEQTTQRLRPVPDMLRAKEATSMAKVPIWLMKHKPNIMVGNPIELPAGETARSLGPPTYGHIHLSQEGTRPCSRIGPCPMSTPRIPMASSKDRGAPLAGNSDEICHKHTSDPSPNNEPAPQAWSH